jgi:excisionase family DNA binding protein
MSKEVIKTITVVPASVLMGADEVCAYLGIGPSRLAELVAEEGLPCTRLGKGEGKGSRRLFHRDLVDQWVLNRIKGSKEVQLDAEVGRRAMESLARARHTPIAGGVAAIKASGDAEAYRIR